MARKGKTGLDYFSHDVNLRQDIKVKILKAKHGFIAYGIYMALLEEAYKETGYFLELTDDFNIIFTDDNSIDYKLYEDVVNYCVEKELFDNGIYKKYNVLTSKRMQSNFIEGTQRRKQVDFIKEYLLVECKHLYPTEKVNVNILTLNVDIKVLNDNSGTQIERKEKGKGKESKEKVMKHDNKKLFLDCVKLTSIEYDKLVEQFNLNETLNKIQNLNDYIMSKGTKYKSHYHTILSWSRNDKASTGKEKEVEAPVDPNNPFGIEV